MSCEHTTTTEPGFLVLKACTIAECPFCVLLGVRTALALATAEIDVLDSRSVALTKELERAVERATGAERRLAELEDERPSPEAIRRTEERAVAAEAAVEELRGALSHVVPQSIPEVLARLRRELGSSIEVRFRVESEPNG